MELILSWCEIRCDRFISVDDMVLFISRWSSCRKKWCLLNVILYEALWCIWTARNKWIFDKIPVNPASTMERIKMTTFSWCKHRGSFWKIDPRVWNINPLFVGLKKIGYNFYLLRMEWNQWIVLNSLNKCDVDVVIPAVEIQWCA